MNPWWVGLIATVPTALLLHVLAPGVFLLLGVLLYPKGHKRRQEFMAELPTVPPRKRLFWAAGVLVHCLREGIPSSLQDRRTKRTIHQKMQLAEFYSEIWLYSSFIGKALPSTASQSLRVRLKNARRFCRKIRRIERIRAKNRDRDRWRAQVI